MRRHGERHGPTVASVVARTDSLGLKRLRKATRALRAPRLQNLCGVATPRSVGSTPAPLRQAVCGFHNGLSGFEASSVALSEKPLETAAGRLRRWRTVARMWRAQRWLATIQSVRAIDASGSSAWC